MTVLVAMPYFGCPGDVGRAVASVLAQTMADLRLVVIGDGEDPPALPDDPRLVVHVLPENRGTYFAHAIMLAASPFEWYAPVDADDWVDPGHLGSLLAVSGGADPVLPRRIRLWSGSREPRPFGTGRYHVGLIPTARLRAVGGYDPTERLGQDSLVIRLLRLTGNIRDAADITYNRVRRPGSLTMAPETGHRSEARAAARRRNREVATAAQRLGSAERIRAWRERRVPPDIARAVAAEAAILRSRLAPVAIAA